MNYVCCPVCGAVLQKSSIALAEVKCSNCRTVLKIYGKSSNMSTR